MLESDYQKGLVKQLRARYKGCIILKNDSGYLQGIPDLLILFRSRWACLEVKASAKAKLQPNQQYYVDQINEMSFGAFIYPENERDVLRQLDHHLFS